MTIDFEPFRPINTSLYLCDNKFHTQVLHHLLEKGVHLPTPDAVVQRNRWLVGGSESEQIQAEHPPAFLCESWSRFAPVAAGCSETMEQQDGRPLFRSQDPPVAGPTLPTPVGLVTPVGSLVSSGGQSTGRSGTSLSRGGG